MTEIIPMLLTGILAGFLGSMLGVGGGVVIVPFLTLFFGINIKLAIAASLMSIIATSMVSSSIYIEKKMIDYRLAIIMLPLIIIGSFTGAQITVRAPQRIIEIIFSILLIYTSITILRGKKPSKNTSPKKSVGGKKPLINGKREVIGILLSYFAGIVSGLLGIGGGALLVPILNVVMDVPLKSAIATSLLIIGGTASMGATVYLNEGITEPHIAGLLIIGIIFGATLGAKTMLRLKTKYIRIAFAVFLIYTAIRMIVGEIL